MTISASIDAKEIRTDVDDDRVVGIDQIIGRISKDCRASFGASLLRGRIGMGNEFRGHLACCAKSGIVENGKILFDRTRCCIRIDRRRIPIRSFGCVMDVDVCLDQAGVDGETLPANQTFEDASMHCGFKDVTKEIAVAEPAMPIFGERRVVRNRIRQVQSTESAIRQVQVDLFTKPSLRSNAKAAANKEPPDHQFGIDQRSNCGAVKGR